MSNESGGGRIGFMGILFVVFLTLKLAGVGAVAAWSWWWVTAPLWGPLALFIPLIAVVGGAKAIMAAQDHQRLQALRTRPTSRYACPPVACPKPMRAIPPVAPIKPVKPNRMRKERTGTSGRRYGAMGANFGWGHKGE